jgi:phosphoserine phosphatase RsbX
MTGRQLIEHGVVHWARPGDQQCGDVEVVSFHDSGALLAVVDGIGHGTEAFLAAEAARGVLEAHPREPVATLVERCHEALRHTRGAVMSLASVDTAAGMMSWLGVGNVRAILYQSSRPGQSDHRELLLRPGIVGVQLPPLLAESVALRGLETLVFATDGIRSNFADRRTAASAPEALARHIMANYRLGTDDALVLVARMP